MNKSTTLPRLLPFKRAARDVGLSYTSLRDAHFRGELAIVRIGRAWYVDVKELARFIDAQTDRGGRTR